LGNVAKKGIVADEGNWKKIQKKMRRQTSNSQLPEEVSE